jgi:hypothetical protein
MSRHPVLTLSLALSLTLPCALGAQNAIVPFLAGGLARGMGNLSDDTGSGWMLLGGLDLSFDDVTPGFGVGLAGSFAQIPYAGGFDEAAQVMAVSLEAIYSFGEAASTMRPFVRAGGGVHVRRYDPGDIPTFGTSATRPGFSAGAGANILAGSVDVIAGARFTGAADGGFLAFHGGLAIPLR